MKMTELLPYIALGVTSVVMLFGNDVVGAAGDASTQVQVALAVITQNQQHQRELSEIQLINLQSIEAKVNANSEHIAVLTHAIKSTGVLGTH